MVHLYLKWVVEKGECRRERQKWKRRENGREKARREGKVKAGNKECKGGFKEEGGSLCI